MNARHAVRGRRAGSAPEWDAAGRCRRRRVSGGQYRGGRVRTLNA